MSRKGENIYRRKDGRWEGRYIIERKGDGKYRYGYVYADTYQKVKQELVSRKSGVAVCAAQVKSQPAEKKPLLKDYAIKWLESVKYHVKESTYVKYWNLVHSYIIPELGDIPWNCLNRETAELFCSRMLSAGGQKKRGLSAKTVSDIMTVLHHIFRFASDHGAATLFDISPITIKKETKEMQILTDGEQKKLCGFLRDNLDDRNLGILICMYAGLRLGEICALKWEDISLSEQIICVRHTMQRIQTKDDPKRKTRIVITAPKSQNSVRRFPIPDELAKILSAYQKGKQGFVLTGKEDSFVEPRTMERHFVKVLKLAGIRQINFHALRHTFATRCVELEFDVKSLSEILGHANVNITLNRYVHPTMEQKRKNMQKLSRLLAVS